MFFGQSQRVPIATRQEFVFITLAAVPDGSDGVNDPFGSKAISFGDLGFAGIASIERPAFFQKLGAGGAVNRSIDTSAAQETLIGGVDNRVHGKRGDIALNDFNARVHWQAFLECHQSPVRLREP